MVVCLAVSCTHNKTSLSVGSGVISLSSPQDVILSQVSLKRFEECLGENFCRVHRSYIISLSHINYIERKRIRIEGTLIPVSDSYLPMLMSRLRIQI